MGSELMDEFKVLRERWKSAQRCMQIHDVPQLKLSLKIAHGFLDRWQGESHELAVEQTLSQLRERNRRIVAVLESWFLQAVHRVIDRRISWLIAEHRFGLAVEYIRAMQNASCDLQMPLRDFFWDEFGYEFDPGRLYGRSEAEADRRERDYIEAFSALRADWPERINEELRSRLSVTDPRQLRSWKATLPMPRVAWG